MRVTRPDAFGGVTTSHHRLEADPDTPGQAVVEALEQATALPVRVHHCWVERTRVAVQPADRIGAAHLRSGDHLVLARPDAPPAWAHRDPTLKRHAFELLVVGGPLSGARHPLPPGRVIVGRDPSCTLVLADEQASRQHLEIEISTDGVALRDLGSTNGTVVDGRRRGGGDGPSDTAAPLLAGQVVEMGSTLFTVEPVEDVVSARQAQLTEIDGQLAFNRPPRVQRPRVDATVRVPLAPTAPFRRKFPLSAALVPIVMGVALAAALNSPVMLLFCAMGPVMMGFSVFEDRRGGHKEFREMSAKFADELATLDDRVAVLHDQLVRDRRDDAPSPAHLLDRAARRRPELWERRPTDKDFLVVRVGVSDMPGRLIFEGGQAEAPDPVMQAQLDALQAEHASDPDVPVDVDLRGIGVLGVAGDDASRHALLRWIIVQAAVLDSPRELSVVVLAPADQEREWDFTKWLPHTTTLVAGMPGARTVASHPDDVRTVFQLVDDLLTQRRLDAERRVGFADTAWLPHVLVVIPGELEIPRPSLSRMLAAGPQFGVSVVVGAATSEYLPGECRAVVRTGSRGNDWSVTVTSTGDTIPGIVGDAVSLEAATGAAMDLAPIRDVSAATATSEVPRQVLLLDVLELDPLSADAVRDRWDRHRDDPGLGAPLGMGPAGVVSIDLRRDGPHGLTAGTTGAGKSELLQSYVAALAATYPASKLTFVLVDYKGGAAFKDCVDLPHTVGFFTDLDPHLAQRALVSLNAELRRREHVLGHAGAKDLIDLERRDPANAPANLFIVFDEFAFLKKEVPEFVAGVIDIAQRGRSLGVHLMLATQRPSGVVDDHIRANTNLRIALRIADEADSNDVLDRPDAAHIPKGLPGRAFVRTGHTDVVVVQAAYGGAVSGTSGQMPTRVTPFALAPGLRSAGPSGGGAGGGGGGGGGAGDDEEERPTDLQRLVSAIREAHVAAAIPDQPLPWLPPVDGDVELGVLLRDHALPAGSTELVTPLGLSDVPEAQAIRPAFLDLGDVGHLLVYGTSGSGKTTLLRSMAASLASRLWPTDLHLYVLDFASRGLRALESLPHVGAVITADEVERTERLVTMLEREVAARKATLGAVGASSLVEYRAAHGPLLPYIVVLLDGYAGFSSVFMNVDHGALVEALSRLVGEGRAVGLHLVITADRRNAIPSTLSGVVPTRLVLRMADADEYATLGLPMSTAQAVLPAGRGFLPDGHEVQLAVLGTDTTGAGQSEMITQWAAQFSEQAAAHGLAGPPPVELLPELVRASSLPPVTPGRRAVPIGLQSTDLGPAWVDLDDLPTFLVMGPDRSGRTSLLVTLASGVMAATPGIEAYLLAPRRSALADLDGWTDVASGMDACEELASGLADEVRARAGTNAAPVLVVVDDGDELTEGRASYGLDAVVKRGRDAGVVLLVASQTHVVHRTFGGWLTEVRKAKHGLFLAPDVDIDGELLGSRLPHKAGRTFPAGRGYLVCRGRIDYTQFALPE